MTYEQLIARVAQISHRNDLSDQMQNFVNDATEQIETRLTVYLDPPSPGITNDILETQPNLYLYATLVSCYEYINEGVSAEYYYKRWLDEIDYYYITATEGQTTALVMGTTGETAENAVANPVYMPKSGGTFTGPVYGLTAAQGANDTQLATTAFVANAASQLGGVFGPVNSSAGYIPTWADATGELLTNGIDPSTLATDAELTAGLAGKVTGPASSTANYVPQWDGATGKLLVNGKPVQTSATDTTASALMTVGAFGLGTETAMPLSSPDFNLQLITGVYAVGGTSTNGPTTAVGTLFVWGNNSTSGRTVQHYVAQATGAYYFRARSSGVWGAWQQVMTSSNSLGVGQTWQNLNASRALGVNYTNSTGRPIQVVASITFGTSNSSVLGSVDSVPVSAGFAGSATSSGATITYIVPNGSSYTIGAFSGTGQTISQWAELR